MGLDYYCYKFMGSIEERWGHIDLNWGNYLNQIEETFIQTSAGEEIQSWLSELEEI